MEAFAALASALGPGGSGALLRALDAVELRAGGAGVVHAVQARLARKVLPKLGEQGLVEYGVPLLPSSGHCRGSCPPPGADTEWLLMGSRSRSAHGHCGNLACRDALHGPACAQRGLSPRRVLSAGRGKNKLPWENELLADREGGSAVRVPVTKAVEQLAASNDFLHSPKLRGIPGSADLFSSRSRAPRTFLELNSEHPALGAGALGSHQPQISGRCGTLGYPQARGRSGSVGSDLQFLGLNNCQQDKVCSSLSFSSKPQRSFCTQAEPIMSFHGPSASQGTFILPSFPLSSPRNSPKHLSSPAASPGKCQEDPRSLSSSWPLKSFEGLPKPGCQKQLLSQKPGEGTGDSLLEKHSLQLEKHSLQLEKPPLQLEKPPLQLEKPPLQLERHSLQLEKPPLQLDKHSLQLEKPPLQLEKPPLQLDKNSLQLDKPPLQLEKPPLQLEKHSLQLDKNSLQLEKPPLQLRAALGRAPGGLRGARPVPPIPRLPSPREPPGTREGTGLAAGLAQLHLEPDDQEEMQNSLRSLRSSAARKRAKLSSSMGELESSGLSRDSSGLSRESPGLSRDSPGLSRDRASLGSSPGTASREPPGSPVPPRRRVM